VRLRPRPRTFHRPSLAGRPRRRLRPHAFIVNWLFESGATLASASAFIGAVILFYPIVVTAIKVCGAAS